MTVQLEKPGDLQGWAARNFRLEVDISSDNEGEEFVLQPYLIPSGAILVNDKYKHNDYKLHANRTVTVRKKKSAPLNLSPSAQTDFVVARVNRRWSPRLYVVLGQRSASCCSARAAAPSVVC